MSRKDSKKAERDGGGIALGTDAKNAKAWERFLARHAWYIADSPVPCDDRRGEEITMDKP